VQSGSDAVLKAMGRKYTRQRYLDTVLELRRACPQIALTTDIIVGFPGETAQDFEDTLELMRQVRYESSFSFKYSDRPGVRAEKMDFKVPEEEKARRLAVLQGLQDRITVEEPGRAGGVRGGGAGRGAEQDAGQRTYFLERP
jgi:tRNA-2-methylthio-N6-dimethylallyladenosine synthase